MTATLIATTSTREIRALGTGGQLTIGAAGALLALLAQKLTPEHASLFAEPQPNVERGEVDWYAQGNGPPHLLSQLPADQQAGAQALLNSLGSDIRGLIAQLRDAPGESDRFLAEMLDLALRVPDGDAVRVRDGRPVLVGWGHERIGPISTVPVIGMARHVRPPMTILPPPAAPEPRRPHLWPWLVAVVGSLLLLIGATLLPVVSPWAAGPRACNKPIGDPAALTAWRAADARNAALHAEFAALLDDAGRRGLLCPPVTPAAAPTDATRAQSHGAHIGQLQIILAWDDRSDLDLHVICPDGAELFYKDRSVCGGLLDVDANSREADATTTPVENAFWADPTAGTYQVIVAPYQIRDGSSSAFRITIRQQGQPDHVTQGRAIEGGDPVHVTSVEVVRP